MSDDIRNEIRRLLDETSFSQAEVVRALNEEGTKVNVHEFSSFMNGLSTPKSRKALTGALAFLTKEKLKQQALLDAARSV